jgi:hypothetical protein
MCIQNVDRKAQWSSALLPNLANRDVRETVKMRYEMVTQNDMIIIDVSSRLGEVYKARSLSPTPFPHKPNSLEFKFESTQYKILVKLPT